jgi:hypothetical protein
MYRDSAHALDERDRAVGAILIGEALIDECDRIRAVVDAQADETIERWRALTAVHDTYPEIWRHLDRARDLLEARGATTAGYDELRPHVHRAPTTTDGARVEVTALEEARQAVDELKLVVPGADWDGIHARTSGLVKAPLARARGQRTVLIAVLALLALGATTWIASIIPEHKIGRREAMRRELSEIQSQRKVRIEFLRIELGNRCDAPRARELAKQLVFDGRGPEARVFGRDYIARCGDDLVVDNWANAPQPRR